MSTAQRYRKKPIEIDAMRLTAENAKDVCDWMQSAHVLGHTPPLRTRATASESTASS